MSLKSNEINMIEGKMLPKILQFTFPLMFSGILQLLYNAADIIVVGRYAGSDAMGAVGSTAPVINLFVNLFVGLSVGANVIVAVSVGANDKKGTSEAVHTSILTSLICGLFLGIVGFFFSTDIMKMMNSPDNILKLGSIYLKVYFLGMPFNLIYNFGSAILRAVGDTKRPLIYLSISGVINIILNLIFVICFKMSAMGVALATIISQAVSAVLVIRCLMLVNADYKLYLSKLKINKNKLKKIVKVGLPAGIQGSLFSISNVLIQASVNSFGTLAIAGNTAGGNIEGFIYTSMNSFYSATLAFTGQNVGAKKFDRASKVLIYNIILVSVIGGVMGAIALTFRTQLLSIYSSDMDVINYGIKRMAVICSSYFLCGIMDVISGQLRGYGYSITPMIVSLAWACVFRVIWIFTVFREYSTLFVLYISYPISWIMIILVNLICYLVLTRKYRSKYVKKVIT